MATGNTLRAGFAGGGPSGIAAAWFLMKKGVQRCDDTEMEKEVGGKCLTVDYTE
jgi:protoporphyrinogen oxidase